MPESEKKPTERYYSTPYYDSYQKGITGAVMTLDEKNGDKILENLVVVILNDVIEQNSNNAAALSALGCLFASLGENLEIATIFCQQSVDIAPDNGLFRHRLGRLYLKENQFDDALRQFKEADRLGYDSRQYIEQIENKHISRAS